MQNLKKNWFVVSKMTRIWWILTWALEILKIFTLIGSFCAKYITFDLKKYRGVIFHDTTKWFKIWRKTDLWFGKGMNNISNIHHSTRKSQNSNIDGILLSKVENIWAQNFQRSYVSWQWRITQNLKRNWLVVSDDVWPKHSKYQKFPLYWAPFEQSR